MNRLGSSSRHGKIRIKVKKSKFMYGLNGGIGYVAAGLLDSRLSSFCIGLDWIRMADLL